MFKGVTYFKDKEFFDSHREFWLYTPKEARRYEVTACWVDSADEIYSILDSFQDSPEDLAEYLASKCSYALELPEEIQSVCILATCSYETDNSRTYLMGIY